MSDRSVPAFYYHQVEAQFFFQSVPLQIGRPRFQQVVLLFPVHQFRRIVYPRPAGLHFHDDDAAYLEACGYTVLESNWRVGHKEIDIICTDGDRIIVVEVKTRRAGVDYPAELMATAPRFSPFIRPKVLIKNKQKKREQQQYPFSLPTGRKIYTF